MILTFTGTRHGMTFLQRVQVAGLIAELKPEIVNHGDCVGADAEFHELVRLRLPDTKIVIWPGPDGPFRAHKKGDEIKPEMTHLARNRAMVDAASVVVGTPYEMERQERGGTWYTIGYARKKKRDRYVVWPGGGIGDVDREPIHTPEVK